MDARGHATPSDTARAARAGVFPRLAPAPPVPRIPRVAAVAASGSSAPGSARPSTTRARKAPQAPRPSTRPATTRYTQRPSTTACAVMTLLPARVATAREATRSHRRPDAGPAAEDHEGGRQEGGQPTLREASFFESSFVRLTSAPDSSPGPSGSTSSVGSFLDRPAPEEGPSGPEAEPKAQEIRPPLPALAADRTASAPHRTHRPQRPAHHPAQGRPGMTRPGSRPATALAPGLPVGLQRGLARNHRDAIAPPARVGSSVPWPATSRRREPFASPKALRLGAPTDAAGSLGSHRQSSSGGPSGLVSASDTAPLDATCRGAPRGSHSASLRRPRPDSPGEHAVWRPGADADAAAAARAIEAIAAKCPAAADLCAGAAGFVRALPGGITRAARRELRSFEEGPLIAAVHEEQRAPMEALEAAWKEIAAAAEAKSAKAQEYVQRTRREVRSVVAPEVVGLEEAIAEAFTPSSAVPLARRRYDTIYARHDRAAKELASVRTKEKLLGAVEGLGRQLEHEVKVARGDTERAMRHSAHETARAHAKEETAKQVLRDGVAALTQAERDDTFHADRVASLEFRVEEARRAIAGLETELRQWEQRTERDVECCRDRMTPRPQWPALLAATTALLPAPVERTRRAPSVHGGMSPSPPRRAGSPGVDASPQSVLIAAAAAANALCGVQERDDAAAAGRKDMPTDELFGRLGRRTRQQQAAAAFAQAQAAGLRQRGQAILQVPAFSRLVLEMGGAGPSLLSQALLRRRNDDFVCRAVGTGVVLPAPVWSHEAAAEHCLAVGFAFAAFVERYTRGAPLASLVVGAADLSRIIRDLWSAFADEADAEWRRTPEGQAAEAASAPRRRQSRKRPSQAPADASSPLPSAPASPMGPGSPMAPTSPARGSVASPRPGAVGFETAEPLEDDGAGVVLPYQHWPPWRVPLPTEPGAEAEASQGAATVSDGTLHSAGVSLTRNPRSPTPQSRMGDTLRAGHTPRRGSVALTSHGGSALSRGASQHSLLSAGSAHSGPVTPVSPMAPETPARSSAASGPTSGRPGTGATRLGTPPPLLASTSRVMDGSALLGRTANLESSRRTDHLGQSGTSHGGRARTLSQSAPGRATPVPRRDDALHSMPPSWFLSQVAFYAMRTAALVRSTKPSPAMARSVPADDDGRRPGSRRGKDSKDKDSRPKDRVGARSPKRSPKGRAGKERGPAATEDDEGRLEAHRLQEPWATLCSTAHPLGALAGPAVLLSEVLRGRVSPRLFAVVRAAVDGLADDLHAAALEHADACAVAAKQKTARQGSPSPGRSPGPRGSTRPSGRRGSVTGGAVGALESKPSLAPRALSRAPSTVGSAAVPEGRDAGDPLDAHFVPAVVAEAMRLAYTERGLGSRQCARAVSTLPPGASIRGAEALSAVACALCSDVLAHQRGAAAVLRSLIARTAYTARDGGRVASAADVGELLGLVRLGPDAWPAVLPLGVAPDDALLDAAVVLLLPPVPRPGKGRHRRGTMRQRTSLADSQGSPRPRGSASSGSSRAASRAHVTRGSVASTGSGGVLSPEAGEWPLETGWTSPGELPVSPAEAGNALTPALSLPPLPPFAESFQAGLVGADLAAGSDGAASPKGARSRRGTQRAGTAPKKRRGHSMARPEALLSPGFSATRAGVGPDGYPRDPLPPVGVMAGLLPPDPAAESVLSPGASRRTNPVSPGMASLPDFSHADSDVAAVVGARAALFVPHKARHGLHGELVADRLADVALHSDGEALFPRLVSHVAALQAADLYRRRKAKEEEEKRARKYAGGAPPPLLPPALQGAAATAASVSARRGSLVSEPDPASEPLSLAVSPREAPGVSPTNSAAANSAAMMLSQEVPMLALSARGSPAVASPTGRRARRGVQLPPESDGDSAATPTARRHSGLLSLKHFVRDRQAGKVSAADAAQVQGVAQGLFSGETHEVPPPYEKAIRTDWVPVGDLQARCSMLPLALYMYPAL